ncbi:hypothetical protein [Nodosilinea nodulosa]|uniref:hypothetical protein n=1 Tax=Nodosilinea nodulosa TaxID=416001 RepID=UPI0003757DFD|nr:hypothetical protein [Nodosilinea nodulosa]
MAQKRAEAQGSALAKGGANSGVRVAVGPGLELFYRCDRRYPWPPLLWDYYQGSQCD